MNQTPTSRAFSESPAKLLRQLRSRILFRLFDPGVRVKNKLLRFADADVTLETINTIINGESPLNADKFLAGMPRMSTIGIGYLINAIVRGMNPSHAYLNVGVWQGFTFLAGLAGNSEKRCIGVDNFSQFGGPREESLAGYARYRSPSSAFHDMDYEAYFATEHAGPIGLYFYDGKHDYADQLRALELAEPFFSPDTLILVDDTNDEQVRGATLDFMRGRSGRYELLLDERTAGNSHPTFWNGLMILGPADAVV